MLTYATDRGGAPAPEGMHQDGVSFIVSAMVLERANVEGGISSIYYNDSGDLALEVKLSEGEGILQSDLEHGYWHSVSPVFPVVSTKPAYRSIIGLDIEFI